MITASERRRQIEIFHLVKLNGRYFTKLLGEYVPYSFGQKCSDKDHCRECFGCHTGCNCGCAVGEQGESPHSANHRDLDLTVRCLNSKRGPVGYLDRGLNPCFL